MRKRRDSHALYVGEQIPERRTRGQRAHTEKAIKEDGLRTLAVEQIATWMLRGETRKGAVLAVAKSMHRNPAALDLLFKQNGDDAIRSAAGVMGTKYRERARELLARREERRARAVRR